MLSLTQSNLVELLIVFLFCVVVCVVSFLLMRKSMQRKVYEKMLQNELERARFKTEILEEAKEIVVSEIQKTQVSQVKK